jgi:hypothetical protein
MDHPTFSHLVLALLREREILDIRTRINSELLFRLAHKTSLFGRDSPDYWYEPKAYLREVRGSHFLLGREGANWEVWMPGGYYQAVVQAPVEGIVCVSWPEATWEVPHIFLKAHYELVELLSDKAVYPFRFPPGT